MEKTIAEHLGEEYGDAITGQLGDVYASILQPLDLADRHASHALHDHHLGAAKVPKNLGNEHQIEAIHVAAQLRSIRCFADQVQFIVQVIVKLGHHLTGLETLAVGRQALDPTGHHAHEAQVFFNHRQHARPQDLHCDFTLHTVPVEQGGEVHLGNGCTGDWRALKRQKYRIHRLLESSLDGGNGHTGVERWHPVLQQRQFVGDVRRQQVAARGQHLAKLHEDRAQLLQRLAQALAPRGVQIAPDGQDARERAQPGLLKAVQHQGIQPVSEHHP